MILFKDYRGNSIQDNPNNYFEPVKSLEIEDAEKDMGIRIPYELSCFYTQIGCGFMESKDKAINRIIAPSTCADIRLRRDIYAWDLDLEAYAESEHFSMLFFEINEGLFASIELDAYPISKIYFGNEVIANSLVEFIQRIYNSHEVIY